MRRTMVLVLAIMTAASLTATVGVRQEEAKAAPPSPPPFLYPDLRTADPSELRFDKVKIRRGVRHEVLRFTNSVQNVGAIPLDLHGFTVRLHSGKKTEVYQLVHNDVPRGEDGRRAKLYKVGIFEYHKTHDHFHFGSFARYELWTKAQYDQWLQSGRSRGQDDPKRISTKTTFCVMDVDRLDPHLPGSPEAPVYSTCGRTHQGLSVGWADSYIADLPDQWVDLGNEPLADGSYVLRSVADPGNRLYESPQRGDSERESNKANAAVTFFEVSAGTITVTDDPARSGEVAQPPSNLDGVTEQLEARGY
jgi:hypothetical protein